MDKRMTTKPESEVASSGNKSWRIVGLAGSSMISLASVGAMIVFGFSWWLLFAAVTGFGVSVASFLTHYIKSGAYLENGESGQKRRIESRLNSLKFKVEDPYSIKIDQVLELLKKRKEFEKQFQKLLLSYFSETEMTYDRYWSLWLEVSVALEKEAENIAENLEATSILKESGTILLEKIDKSLGQMNLLMKRSEELYFSFQENKKEENREVLFSQLEELSKRTKKYLDI